MAKFEIGEMVLTTKGIGWIELINKTSEFTHYLIRLSHDHGIYYFNDKQVFKCE